MGVLWIEASTCYLVDDRAQGGGYSMLTAVTKEHNCPIGYERTECIWIELIVAE